MCIDGYFIVPKEDVLLTQQKEEQDKTKGRYQSKSIPLGAEMLRCSSP